MDRQSIDETVATVQANAANQSQSDNGSWEARAEDCLRDIWHFLNRKVIDLHSDGRITDAAELSDVREQVHTLLSERPLQQAVSGEVSGLHHPVTQLAEGSGLPESDDPTTYMPSLP